MLLCIDACLKHVNFHCDRWHRDHTNRLFWSTFNCASGKNVIICWSASIERAARPLSGASRPGARYSQPTATNLIPFCSTCVICMHASQHIWCMYVCLCVHVCMHICICANVCVYECIICMSGACMNARRSSWCTLTVVWSMHQCLCLHTCAYTYILVKHT